MKTTKIILLAMLISFGLNTMAQVAINNDGSAPDGSAMLDVKSNNGGFLPPRMTQSERNQITNPIPGLIVFCTDCIEMQMYNGTEWVNIDGSPATPPPNLAPVASNISFSGDLEVGQMLTGSYTYSDNESDTEGTSIYQWFRADDASGTNQSMIGSATSLTYILQAADDSKFIAFEVVPVAQTGASPGAAVMSPYQGAITTNQAPVASNVSFSGTLEVGQMLTGSYTYSDNESDPEGTSTYQWYRADDASGTNEVIISGSTSLTYILQAADDSKQIAFEVVPLAQTGTSSGVAVMSSYQGPIITANQVPVASNVSFTGVLQVGQMLTGSYAYSDNESDTEGTSTYKWYRADDGSGTNQSTISGATNQTYTLQPVDDSKYISFEVTPVAQTGASPGAAVMSSYQGAITTNQAPNQPTNPSPSDASTDQAVNSTLSWSCSDPDSDPLTYDVYFGETNPPSLVSSGQTATTYDPGTLNYNTTYYWKITVYDGHSHSTEGSVWSFTTIAPPWTCGDALVDSRDSQSYTTVQIGTQCWMQENLNIGTMINGSSNQTQNSPTEIIEKYCYSDNTSNCDTYGGLYQWDEMMQYVTTEGTQGICPDGWHIPTDAEWCTLENEVDVGTVDCNTMGWRGTDAGGNLKDTTIWNSPNTGATNSSSFTVLPGGARFINGSFDHLTTYAHLWSSSEDGSGALYPGFSYGSAKASRNSGSHAYGFSVRCLRD